MFANNKRSSLPCWTIYEEEKCFARVGDEKNKDAKAEEIYDKLTTPRNQWKNCKICKKNTICKK